MKAERKKEKRFAGRIQVADLVRKRKSSATNVVIASVRVEPRRNRCPRIAFSAGSGECSMTEIYSVGTGTRAAEFTRDVP